MRIAVIGAGAMGSIYGGRLSLKNDVYLIDTNPAVIEAVNTGGLVLEENGQDNTYSPKALTSAAGLEPVDLVILFVKALYSKAALSGNRNIIGPDTYLMTLQNGSGHEDILSEFATTERIIIGTTEDNGAVLSPGHIRHGGKGNTNIGMLVPDTQGFLPKVKECFDACGFNVKIHSNIQQLIWNKLFVNVALSAVTGILKCEIGYVYENENAFALTKSLLHEAVTVAHALGLEADEAAITDEIIGVCTNSPHGVTSICADLRAGRKTEVATISGSVVRAAEKCGVDVPCHKFIVNIIHAMENMK
ncbi:MAG: ketopantoate reductase family protein [Synergistaceae bacterium]|nr:ketopantoate reductase family protein [Synergistaceae bacterium]